MSKLFAVNQTKGGSIYITMKRIDTSKKPTPKQRRPIVVPKGKGGKQQAKKVVSKIPPPAVIDPDQPLEHMCLIRVCNNSRKISTIVKASDVNKFQQAYSNLLRGNLYGLKKKKEKKKSGNSNKKSKATQ